MKRILGIFLALAVALSLILVPATVSANPVTVTVFTAGVNDNFALPTEPTSPSSNFLAWLSSIGANLKDFDDPQWDRFVAHTFDGLPQEICEATLEIHLRAGASPLSVNDSINLFFIGDDQVAPSLGSERWYRQIGDYGGDPGVLGYEWRSLPGASPTVATIILDLSNLPLAVGQPSSASNLIPALNQHGFLDIYIQDDTDVDYMTLTITSNCLDIEKVLEGYDDADGDGLIEVGEETSFVMTITVTNNSDDPMTDVVVNDRLGGELELDGYVASTGTVTTSTQGKTAKVFVTWNVGTLAPGALATLTLTVSTDINPGGHQEYTEPGRYTLNSGANAKAMLNGLQVSATSHPIYVTVLPAE